MQVSLDKKIELQQKKLTKKATATDVRAQYYCIVCMYVFAYVRMFPAFRRSMNA